MSLPEWCQTHSLKDFFELIEPKRKEPMNETFPNTFTEAQPAVAAPLTDEQVQAILGLAIVDADQVSEDKEVTVH